MNSHLIILPGNSPSNKEWAERARDFFAPDFVSVAIQHYDHWSSGEEVINIEKELKKLKDTVNSLEGPVTILAKSVGTVLTMYTVHSKVIDPARVKKCIFVGFPPKWVRAAGFDIDSWSSDFTVPTTLIQNDRDPVTSAEEIRKEQATGKFKALKLVEWKGDDHRYDDFVGIENYLIQT